MFQFRPSWYTQLIPIVDGIAYIYSILLMIILTIMLISIFSKKIRGYVLTKLLPLLNKFSNYLQKHPLKGCSIILISALLFVVPTFIGSNYADNLNLPYQDHPVSGKIQMTSQKDGKFIQTEVGYPKTLSKDYFLDTSDNTTKTIIENVPKSKNLKTGSIIDYHINGVGDIIIDNVHN